MVELLAAGLTGGKFGFETHNSDPSWGGPSSNGQFIIAIDPTHFIPKSDAGSENKSTAHDNERENLDLRIETFLSKIGENGGRLPGERRHQIRAKTALELKLRGMTENTKSQGTGSYIYELNAEEEEKWNVEVPDELYREIVGIINGEMNVTQGYPTPSKL